MTSSPLVSSIIMTRNEALVLAHLLDLIGAHAYPNREVILIDNNSMACTKESARRYTPFVLHQEPERAAQRSADARQARGEHLRILDADTELTPEVATDCVALAQQPRGPDQAALGGVIIPEISYGGNSGRPDTPCHWCSPAFPDAGLRSRQRRSGRCRAWP